MEAQTFQQFVLLWISINVWWDKADGDHVMVDSAAREPGNAAREVRQRRAHEDSQLPTLDSCSHQTTLRRHEKFVFIFSYKLHTLCKLDNYSVMCFCLSSCTGEMCCHISTFWNNKTKVS